MCHAAVCFVWWVARATCHPPHKHTTTAYHIYTLYVSCCCLLCVAGRAGAATRRIDINNVYSSRFNKIRASARILIFLCKLFPDSAWKCSRTNNDNGSFTAFMDFIADAVDFIAFIDFIADAVDFMAFKDFKIGKG